MKRDRSLVRRLAIGTAGVLAVAVAGHALLWRQVTGQMAREFAAGMDQRRALGWTVRHDTPVAGGWPLAAELRVPGLSMSYDGPDLPGGLAWSTAALRLRLSPLAPRTLRLHAEGQQTLRLGPFPAVPYTAESLVLSVLLEPGVPPRDFQLQAEALRAGIPGPAGPAALELARLSAHAELRPAAVQGEPVLGFAAELSGLALPQPAGTVYALGRTIAALSLEGAVTGPWPRAAAPDIRASAWRDGGGTLEIRRMQAEWGKLALSLGATLALDARLQPMGAGNARLTGYGETLDALAAARSITAGTAVAARTLLTMMARPQADGAPPAVEVPLSLQDRRLSMGQIPLARLPELVWPAEP